MCSEMKLCSRLTESSEKIYTKTLFIFIYQMILTKSVFGVEELEGDVNKKVH